MKALNASFILLVIVSLNLVSCSKKETDSGITKGRSTEEPELNPSGLFKDASEVKFSNYLQIDLDKQEDGLLQDTSLLGWSLQLEKMQKEVSESTFTGLIVCSKSGFNEKGEAVSSLVNELSEGFSPVILSPVIKRYTLDFDHFVETLTLNEATSLAEQMLYFDCGVGMKDIAGREGVVNYKAKAKSSYAITKNDQDNLCKSKFDEDFEFLALHEKAIVCLDTLCTDCTGEEATITVADKEYKIKKDQDPKYFIAWTADGSTSGKGLFKGGDVTFDQNEYSLNLELDTAKTAFKTLVSEERFANLLSNSEIAEAMFKDGLNCQTNEKDINGTEIETSIKVLATKLTKKYEGDPKEISFSLLKSDLESYMKEKQIRLASNLGLSVSCDIPMVDSESKQGHLNIKFLKLNIVQHEFKRKVSVKITGDAELKGGVVSPGTLTIHRFDKMSEENPFTFETDFATNLFVAVSIFEDSNKSFDCKQTAGSASYWPGFTDLSFEYECKKVEPTRELKVLVFGEGTYKVEVRDLEKIKTSDNPRVETFDKLYQGPAESGFGFIGRVYDWGVSKKIQITVTPVGTSVCRKQVSGTTNSNLPIIEEFAAGSSAIAISFQCD